MFYRIKNLYLKKFYDFILIFAKNCQIVSNTILCMIFLRTGSNPADIVRFRSNTWNFYLWSFPTKFLYICCCSWPALSVTLAKIANNMTAPFCAISILNLLKIYCPFRHVISMLRYAIENIFRFSCPRQKDSQIGIQFNI